MSSHLAISFNGFRSPASFEIHKLASGNKESDFVNLFLVLPSMTLVPPFRARSHLCQRQEGSSSKASGATDIRRCGAIVLAGPSGSGKTTVYQAAMVCVICI